MPRGGSKPGERRGGRAKGTPDKATAARQTAMAAAVADCFATMTAVEIEGLKPKQVMLMAMHSAMKSGDVLLAVNIAERVAPYYDAKISGPVNVEGKLTLEALVLGAISKEEREAREARTPTIEGEIATKFSAPTDQQAIASWTGLLERSDAPAGDVT